MKKAFATYFFSLCALMLSGVSLGYAHSCQEGALGSQVESARSPSGAGLQNAVYDQAFITNPSPLGTEKGLEIEAIDIEEEEVSSLKRYLGGSGFFAAVFCALALGWVFSSRKRKLSFHTGFPNITSPRWYIVFRVIRL